jgi:hypothetical protein
MAGMDGLFASLLEPQGEGDATIAVLTDTTPERFLERLEPHEGPIAVVDCTGETVAAEMDDNPLYRQVSSPADLTSIGIGIVEFFEAFTDRDLSVRVGLDSLTTLSVYVEAEQLFAFLNTLGPKVTDRGGVFIAALYTHSIEERVQSRVEPLFDGRVELRESPTGSEVRIRSPDGETTAWEPFEGNGVPRESGPSEDRERGESPTFESLGELIQRIESSRLTLSVYNPIGADLGPLRTRMDRLNVRLESIETPKVPDYVAMLHRDGEFLVAEPLDSLLSSLSLDELRNAESELSPIIEHVDGTVSGISGVAKPLLIRASRMFELLAYRSGQGTLHAGFQDLSRFVDDDHVTRLYEGIAGAGVGSGTAADLEPASVPASFAHIFSLSGADLQGWTDRRGGRQILRTVRTFKNDSAQQFFVRPRGVRAHRACLRRYEPRTNARDDGRIIRRTRRRTSE